MGFGMQAATAFFCANMHRDGRDLGAIARSLSSLRLTGTDGLGLNSFHARSQTAPNLSSLYGSAIPRSDAPGQPPRPDGLPPTPLYFCAPISSCDLADRIPRQAFLPTRGSTASAMGLTNQSSLRASKRSTSIAPCASILTLH